MLSKEPWLVRKKLNWKAQFYIGAIFRHLCQRERLLWGKKMAFKKGRMCFEVGHHQQRCLSQKETEKGKQEKNTHLWPAI